MKGSMVLASLAAVDVLLAATFACVYILDRKKSAGSSGTKPDHSLSPNSSDNTMGLSGPKFKENNDSSHRSSANELQKGKGSSKSSADKSAQDQSLFTPSTDRSAQDQSLFTPSTDRSVQDQSLFTPSTDRSAQDQSLFTPSTDRSVQDQSLFTPSADDLMRLLSDFIVETPCHLPGLSADKVMQDRGLPRIGSGWQFAGHKGRSASNTCWAHATAGIINWYGLHDNPKSDIKFKSNEDVVNAIYDDVLRINPRSTFSAETEQLLNACLARFFKNGIGKDKNNENTAFRDLRRRTRNFIMNSIEEMPYEQHGGEEMRELLLRNGLNPVAVDSADASPYSCKKFLDLYFVGRGVASRDICPLAVRVLGHWILLLDRFEEDGRVLYVAYNSAKRDQYEIVDESELCQDMSYTGTFNVVYSIGKISEPSADVNFSFTFFPDIDALSSQEKISLRSTMCIGGLRIPAIVYTPKYKKFVSGEEFYISGGREILINSGEKMSQEREFDFGPSDEIGSVCLKPIGWVRYSLYKMEKGRRKDEVSCERAVPVYQQDGKYFVMPANFGDAQDADSFFKNHCLFDSKEKLLAAAGKGFLNDPENLDEKQTDLLWAVDPYDLEGSKKNRNLPVCYEKDLKEIKSESV